VPADLRKAARAGGAAGHAADTGDVRTVLVINGPNLNLLGTREPGVYGTTSLAGVEKMCRATAAELGVEVEFRQTNHEGRLIDWLHEAGRRQADGGLAGVVLNAGGYAYTSLALRDAVTAAGVRVVEIHVSNVFARESFRHESYLSPVACGVVNYCLGTCRNHDN